MLAILDGTVTDAAQVQIPATDDGFLRGDGVFEVMRLYGGRLFALDDHLTRLGRSAANLRLPIDLDAVRADVEDLVERNDVQDAAMRVVGALLLGQPAGEHVGGVGERLDLVEHPRGGVLDRGQGQRVGQWLELLDERQAATAAGDHHAQRGVLDLVALDERLDVGADGLGVDRQAQVGRRARQPRQVVVERERPAAVEAHDLEHAVTAQEAVVGGGDLRL